MTSCCFYLRNLTVTQVYAAPLPFFVNCLTSIVILQARIDIKTDTNRNRKLQRNYGEKSVLYGNRLGIEHGVGDYILVKTKLVNGLHHPDFNDSGRIINGTIFHKLYKPFYENQDSF